MRLLTLYNEIFTKVHHSSHKRILKNKSHKKLQIHHAAIIPYIRTTLLLSANGNM